MKKRLLSTVLAVAMTAAMLAGCGNKGSGSTEDLDEVTLAVVRTADRRQCGIWKVYEDGSADRGG